MDRWDCLGWSLHSRQGIGKEFERVAKLQLRIVFGND
jgi:hypothetical protein